MERRSFIQSTCNVCLLMAAGFTLPKLIGCSPAAMKVLQIDVVDNAVQLPLAPFAQSNIQIVRPKGWLYEIAVTKNDDNTYQALLLQCTHQDNQLTQTGSGYQCSLHGSQFNKSGKVVKGPAAKPLKQYKTVLGDHQLTILLKA